MNNKQKAEQLWQIRNRVIDDIIDSGQEYTSAGQQAYINVLESFAMMYEELHETRDECQDNGANSCVCAKCSTPMPYMDDGELPY